MLWIGWLLAIAGVWLMTLALRRWMGANRGRRIPFWKPGFPDGDDSRRGVNLLFVSVGIFAGVASIFRVEYSLVAGTGALMIPVVVALTTVALHNRRVAAR